MQGPVPVRSLVRLLLCAAFLCVAWVLLGAGEASAAEQTPPGDGQSRAVPGAGSLLRSLSHAVAPVADPVVEPVATTARSATGTTVAVVDQVGEAVPVLEDPVKAVTPLAAAVVDDVVDVVETRDVTPVLEMPWPTAIEDDHPTEPATESAAPAVAGSRPAKPVAGQQFSAHWMVDVREPMTPLAEVIDAGMAMATQTSSTAPRGDLVPSDGSSGPTGPVAPGPTTSHGGQDCAATPDSVLVVPVGAQGAPTGLTAHVAAPPPSDPGSSPD
jgi:hypothetical protein